MGDQQERYERIPTTGDIPTTPAETYIRVPVEKMVEVFGEPSEEPDDRVSMVWDFRDAESGWYFSVYDFNEWDEEPADRGETVTFRLGACGPKKSGVLILELHKNKEVQEIVRNFIDYLAERLELSPDVQHIEELTESEELGFSSKHFGRTFRSRSAI